MKAVAAGVDTWSVSWYVEPETPIARALEAMAVVPAARSRLLPDKIGGHRVGWFPAAGLAFAEGHPAQLLGDGEGLCAPGRLRDSYGALSQLLADHGLLMPTRRVRREGVIKAGEAGVRRLDLTVDLRFERPADGLAALAGVAAMPLPRIQTAIRRQPGGRAVETVALFGAGGKRMLGRWYDKGVESGLADRGQLIRPEDQRRFVRDARLPVEALGVDAARTMFQRRFLPLWKATEGVTVGSVLRLAERLRELRDEGKITGRQAEQLAGHLVLDAAGVEVMERTTTWRRRARARELGLVLADGTTDPVEVDLHSVLETALEAEDWYGEG